MAYVKKVKATIQLDKLILSCKSTIDDNFTDVILYSKNDIEKSHFQMNNTKIVNFYNKGAYKYSYKVYYLDYLIGIIELGYKGKYSKHIKFTTDNPVFYNGTLQFLPHVFSDLYLEIKCISQLDIAIDNYTKNSIKKLYSCIRNEKYKLLLNGKYVKDMDAIINDIVYWHKGSRRNPNQIKSIYAQSVKKGDKEFTTYDKLKEIETESHKYYILDYHKLYNSNFTNIYRDEVRLGEDILYRYEKQHGKITLQMLLDKQFLFKLFQSFEHRTIEVKDHKGKPVKLYPTPTFEDRAEVMLQHHLPECTSTVSYSFIDNKIKEFNFLNENNLSVVKNDNKDIIKETIYNKRNIITDMRKRRKLSQITKDKISLSMRGSRNPNFGKPLSKEHKEKISESMSKYWNQN